jgi:hypothetical protein
MTHDLMIFGLGIAAAWLIRRARLLWPAATEPIIRRHWSEEEK